MVPSRQSQVLVSSLRPRVLAALVRPITSTFPPHLLQVCATFICACIFIDFDHSTGGSPATSSNRERGGPGFHSGHKWAHAHNAAPIGPPGDQGFIWHSLCLAHVHQRLSQCSPCRLICQGSSYSLCSEPYTLCRYYLPAPHGWWRVHAQDSALGESYKHTWLLFLKLPTATCKNFHFLTWGQRVLLCYDWASNVGHWYASWDCEVCWEATVGLHIHIPNHNECELSLNPKFSLKFCYQICAPQGLVRRSRPYRNNQIIATIQALFFSGGETSFATHYRARFAHVHEDSSISYEAPMPLVALVSTGVSFKILDLWISCWLFFL